jgi:hypothetical protein
VLKSLVAKMVAVSGDAFLSKVVYSVSGGLLQSLSQNLSRKRNCIFSATCKNIDFPLFVKQMLNCVELRFTNW